jgi:hypothetical protein
MAGRASGGAAGLERVRRRLKAWRRRPDRGRGIPGDIWESIADLAEEQGTYRVASELSLNSESIKKRLAARAKGGGGAKAAAASPVFVDLGLEGLPQGRSCVVEFKSADGTSMTVRFEGPCGSDLSALASAYWGRRR